MVMNDLNRPGKEQDMCPSHQNVNHTKNDIYKIMDRIELNPRVCNGKPVIKGTRIPVSVILEQVAEGESWKILLAGYPELTKEDIQAALVYARASLDHTEIRAANA
jgi:uncharacterized protein (DUF433 family)